MSRSPDSGGYHRHPDAATDVRALFDAVEAGSWERADELLNEHFYRYLLTDRDRLLDVFSALPEEWFAQYPRHRLTREIASATGPMQLLSDRVQRDFIEWVQAQENPAARDRLALHTMEMRTTLATGNYLRAASKADDVHEFIESATDTSGFHDLLPSVFLRAGQTQLCVGDLAAASDSFSRAHRWAQSARTHPADRYIRSHLALVDALHGDFVLATSWLPSLEDDDDVDDEGLAHQLKTADLLTRALVSVCGGSAREAEAALERVAYERSTSDLWWVGMHARALYELQWGEPRRGIARLEQALRNHRGASAPGLLAGQLLRADLASLYQVVGELDAAKRVLATPGLERAHPLVRAADTRQSLLSGDPVGAATSIESSRSVLSGGSDPITAVLHAAIEHAASGGATERTVARAADHIRSSGAIHALQEVIEPTRDRILRRLEASYSPPRRQYPYLGVITVDLSQREREVLSALDRLDSVAAIAAALHLSVNTVKTYKRSLYRKLGARNRAEALEYAHMRPITEG